ncbi:MAG: N-acetylmuramoyl-L-alanine amidase, partial [Pseudomonadota bacterium]
MALTSSFRGLFARCLLAAMLFAFLPAQAAELLDVRFGPAKNATRVVFDIDGAPNYDVRGDLTGAGRLLIRFADLEVSGADLNYRRGGGHIGRYGFASRPGGAVEAVLEFKRTAKIKEIFVIEPSAGVSKHRLVVDLLSAEKSAFQASLPAPKNPYPDLASVIKDATETVQEPEKAAPPAPSLKPTAAYRARAKIVVIDPGHGGRDPGAVGPTGVTEKAVNMAAARALKEMLEKRGGYDVVLTRDGDKGVLRDRKADFERRERLARDSGADLFISLHADALADKRVRGASIYTLSKSGQARSASLAKAKGDFVVYDLDVKDFGTEVGDILFDLAQESTNTASSRFADQLIKHLTGEVPLLNRSRRTGELRVLLAPDVPAVLLEMAFISNASD